MYNIKNNDIRSETLVENIFNTISMSIFYICCFLFVIGIFFLITSKIIYHIYLNLFLLTYAFLVKSLETVAVDIIVEQKYNILCSLSVFKTDNKYMKYYDLNMISKDCNISAYCINESILDHIKNNTQNILYIKSYFDNKCVYAQNIYDTYEIFIINCSIIVIFLFFLFCLMKVLKI